MSHSASVTGGVCVQGPGTNEPPSVLAIPSDSALFSFILSSVLLDCPYSQVWILKSFSLYPALDKNYRDKERR